MLARQAFVRWFQLASHARQVRTDPVDSGQDVRARVAVQHRRRLEELLAVLAAAALEQVVRLSSGRVSARSVT